MVRKILTDDTTRSVLIASRRRCCMCYGLNRDVSMKQGQIAHLDKNSANGDLDNLAFLCLEHHDQYDSRTSQSKGFVASEVKAYRQELHGHVAVTFLPPNNSPGKSTIQGHYIRESANESAEIKIHFLTGNTYHIEIFALWGLDREYGPRTGDLEFEAELLDSSFSFSTDAYGSEYKLQIKIDNAALTVSEAGICPFAGLNVRFEGEYGKAA